MKWLIVFLVAFGWTLDVHAYAANDGDVKRKNAETIVFETPIGKNGQSIAVRRGPDRSPAVFNFWKEVGRRDSDGMTEVEQTAAFFELRVELRTPGQPNLLVASDLRPKLANVSYEDRVTVLATEALHGEINIVLAEGTVLQLWRIGFGHAPTVLSQPLNGWSGRQLAYVIAGSRTTAALDRTADGRLRLVILEGDTKLRTVFETSNDGSLEIRKASQQRDEEKVPR